MSFAARYPGKCASCLDPIEVGQEVRYSGSESYGRGDRNLLQHVECEDALVIPEHKAPVCTKCFIEKPCECDDQ